MSGSPQTRLRRKQKRPSSGPPFVQLYKYMLRAPTWLGLSVTARSAYVQLAARYDGVNNGKLAMSARTLAAEIGMSRMTAARALIELEDAGFIETTYAARFTIKDRMASEYRLTTFKCDQTGTPASRKFLRQSKAPNSRSGENPQSHLRASQSHG